MSLWLESETRAAAGILRVVDRLRHQDLDAFLEPLEDFGLCPVVEPDLYRNDGEALAGRTGRDVDNGRVALCLHRFARDEERLLALAHADLHRRGHAGIDAAEDVALDADAGLEDDDVRVDLAAREDEVHLAFESLLRAAGEGDLHG